MGGTLWTAGGGGPRQRCPDLVCAPVAVRRGGGPGGTARRCDRIQRRQRTRDGSAPALRGAYRWNACESVSVAGALGSDRRVVGPAGSPGLSGAAGTAVDSHRCAKLAPARGRTPLSVVVRAQPGRSAPPAGERAESARSNIAGPPVGVSGRVSRRSLIALLPSAPLIAATEQAASSELRRYTDPVTEFPVFRLTSPHHASWLPASNQIAFPRHSNALIYISDRS